MTPYHRRSLQRGQALIEYTLIAGLGVLVLVANADAIPALMNALKQVYEAFVYAISLSWI